MTDTETTQSREQGPRRRSGALILGAAALAAAAGLLGYGAYAAFTDTETSSVSIDAGQLDITLATTPITVTDIAPGDVLYRQVAVQVPGATNDGDLIAALEVSATNVVSTPGDPADTGNPAEGDVAGVGLDAGTDPLQLVVANCDEPWTLPGPGDPTSASPECAGTSTPPTPAPVDFPDVVAGDPLELTAEDILGTPTFGEDVTELNVLVALRLPETAGNEYENAALTFDLQVDAIQRAGIVK